MTDRAIELPVDWFDSPEPPEPFCNNLDPTEAHHADYRGPSMWVHYEPHPDMLGFTCSSGFVHEPRRWERRPIPPVGIASMPVPKHWMDRYPREDES